ncbi:MAG TPA: hypothetical protein VF719_05670, partial [Abditibacteriaceae bacterium]
MPAPSPNETVLAIDPGRDKCGFAIVRGDGEVLDRHIVARAEAVEYASSFSKKYTLTAIVIGDSTSSKGLWEELKNAGLIVETINEKNSTFEARELYWQANPSRGW